MKRTKISDYIVLTLEHAKGLREEARDLLEAKGFMPRRWRKESATELIRRAEKIEAAHKTVSH